MADQYQYLLLLAACLVFTVPLEFVYGFRVWRNPRRLARAVLPGLIVFSLWDLLAVHRGYWQFSQKFTTGWKLPGAVPLEEILFFVVVPIAAISGFEAVRTSMGRKRG